MAAHSLSKLPAFVSAFNPNQTTKPESCSLPLTTTLKPTSLQNLWLGTNSLGVRAQLPKLRPFSSTICLSLPTTIKERVSSNEEVPKWSSMAIKSFAMGSQEAQVPNHWGRLLVQLFPGFYLMHKGLGFKFSPRLPSYDPKQMVREETIMLLGKADMYFFSPEHPALTDEAQRVLDWAVDKKIKSGGSGEITTSHLLLGIWYEVDSPGHKIMASLGFNEEKVKELESLISDG